MRKGKDQDPGDPKTFGSGSTTLVYGTIPTGTVYVQLRALKARKRRKLYLKNAEAEGNF
jgi:hypothetical protein